MISIIKRLKKPIEFTAFYKSALSLLILVLPLIYFAAGLLWYMIISAALLVIFVVEVLLVKYYIRPVIVLLVTMLLSMPIIALVKYKLDFYRMWYIYGSFCSIIFSFWMSKQFLKTVKRSSLISMFIFYGFFVWQGLLKGLAPQAINSFFLNSSRNGVAAIVLMMQLVYSGCYYKYHGEGPLVTPMLTLVVSIFCFGRTGILLASLVLLMTILVNAKERKSLFMVIAVLVIFSLIIAIKDSDILLFIKNNTNFKNKFDTPRALINKEYIDSLTFESVVAGVDLNNIPIVALYEGNPHNSYILGHSSFGLVYLIFIFVLFCYFFYLAVKTNQFYLSFLIVVFFAKASTDIGMLLGVMDIAFYYILLLLSAPAVNCRDSLNTPNIKRC